MAELQPAAAGSSSSGGEDVDTLVTCISPTGHHEGFWPVYAYKCGVLVGGDGAGVLVLDEEEHVVTAFSKW